MFKTRSAYLLGHFGTRTDTNARLRSGTTTSTPPDHINEIQAKKSFIAETNANSTTNFHLKSIILYKTNLRGYYKKQNRGKVIPQNIVKTWPILQNYKISTSQRFLLLPLRTRPPPSPHRTKRVRLLHRQDQTEVEEKLTVLDLD